MPSEVTPSSPRGIRPIRGGHLVGMAVLAAAYGAAAAEAAPEIPLKLVDGMPCAAGTVHYGGKSIPANVVIDLGSRSPLVVHVRTARLLGIEPKKGVEIRFKHLVLRDLPALAADVKALETLTRDYAPELGELPAVAILGLSAFADYTPQLELDPGVLRLLPPEDGRRHVGSDLGLTGDKDAPGCTMAYTEEGYGLWLTATVSGDYRLRVLFRTSGYDTLIDSTSADLAGAPGGQLDNLTVGGLNIAKYVALRPFDLSKYPKPRPDVILGTNLLRHFRATIDAENRRIKLEQTHAPVFPTEERTYFVASSEGDADGIEGFLKVHPQSRLAAEAAERLVGLRLEEIPADRDAIERAVRLRGETAKENRRASVLGDLADNLLQGDRDDKYPLARFVLTVALSYAPKALDANAAHRIQARMGQILMHQGDLKEARRHLLSAAFGMPRDAMTNLWMGELYEKSGNLTRAWSRFVQAAISKEAPPDALKGLDRLNRNPDFRRAFTMDDAQQLLEGRVVEFHPARRYSEDRSTRPRHVRLIELFTCLDQPATQAPELAFAGLGEYFSGTPVALIQYHIASPAVDPLTTTVAQARATAYGIKDAPAAIFDGGRRITTGGDVKVIETLYSEYQRASLSSDTGEPAWRIAGRATVNGSDVAGELTVTGPAVEGDLRLHAILCERVVMVPGANQLVLHQHVARASLSPVDGLVIPKRSGSRDFGVRGRLSDITAGLERSIGEIEKAKNIRFMMRPTYLDPSSLVLVAFIQDGRSKRVLAARQFVPAAKVTQR